MTTRSDLDRSIAAWLVAETPGRAPDDVLEASRARLRTTRQRRHWWPAWRTNRMNIYTKLLAAAVAVLVVAVVGYQLLPGRASIGGPTTAPSPTPGPTARPIAAGALAPGTYFLDRPDRSLVRFTFAVGDGWSARFEDWEITKFTERPESFGFKPFVVTHVFGDACNDAGTLAPVGPTVDDLVRALEAQKNSDATAPIDLTVGGYPAKRVDMSIPAGLDTQTCDQPGILIRIWAEPDFEYQHVDTFAIPASAQNTNGSSRVYIVDVAGERVVFTAGYGPNAPAANIAELEAVLASIRFEP
jgi:hypothetical protein